MTRSLHPEVDGDLRAPLVTFAAQAALLQEMGGYRRDDYQWRPEVAIRRLRPKWVAPISNELSKFVILSGVRSTQSKDLTSYHRRPFGLSSGVKRSRNVDLGRGPSTALRYAQDDRVFVTSRVTGGLTG